MTMSAPLTTAYDAAQFDDNFPTGIEHHYWFAARNRLIDRTLRDAARRGWIDPSAPILEVGCGTGIVVDALHRRGHDVHGAELGHPPRLLAPDRIKMGVRAKDLDADFRKSVGSLMFLDVIEHVPNDVGLIRETLEAFPQCRAVFITVPARPELWSEHDRYYGHFRRYTRRTLRDTLVTAGLEPSTTRYVFRSLYLAALAMRLRGVERDPVMKAVGPTLMNRIGAGILAADDALLGGLPLPGLTVLGVGLRKPN